MQTIVLQSFRTYDVPQWITICRQSVRTWAHNEGWDYEFLDDRFFTLAPEWVRHHCAGNIYAITDVCRLQWMREKLNAGYERVIWADADLLVFAPSRLNVRTQRGHAFAHELFLRLRPGGGFIPLEGMNNALMVFEQHQDILDTYLNTCFERLHSFPSGSVPRTALGPALLTELERSRPLDMLHGIGLFTLALMQEISGGGGLLTQQLVRRSPAPLGAANLCHFLRNARSGVERAKFDVLYNTAVDRLMRSGTSIFR